MDERNGGPALNAICTIRCAGIDVDTAPEEFEAPSELNRS